MYEKVTQRKTTFVGQTRTTMNKRMYARMRPVWAQQQYLTITNRSLYTSRAPAGPGTRWQRAVPVGLAARLPAHQRHNAGASSFRLLSCASCRRGATCASGPADSARPWPRVVPVSYAPPGPHAFSIMGCPAQVLSGTGCGPAEQRNRERKRRATRLTTAQTPRRSLSECWGRKARRNVRLWCPLRKTPQPSEGPGAQETLPPAPLPPEHQRPPFHPHLTPGPRYFVPGRVPNSGSWRPGRATCNRRCSCAPRPGGGASRLPDPARAAAAGCEPAVLAFSPGLARAPPLSFLGSSRRLTRSARLSSRTRRGPRARQLRP